MSSTPSCAIYTIVEGKTLYTLIVALNGKNAFELADRAITALMPLKDQIKTITYDNGLEFAEHERVSKALKLEIYFVHPYSS